MSLSTTTINLNPSTRPPPYRPMLSTPHPQRKRT